ncbi:hypothetical protein GCM10009731_66270 [Streptomyces globosus]
MALVAVLALTGYAVFSGEESGSDTPAKGGASPSASGSASPEPMYSAPADWTEPERWTALPKGQRTDERGSAVGFPHTVEGAIAMMAAANTTRIEGERSGTAEQLRMYHSYFGKPDQTPENAKKIELSSRETDKSLAQEMGVEAGRPLPSGAYMRAHVIGYKVIKKSDDEVSAWVLARAVQKNGEMAKEESSYTRTLVAAQWQDGDWKLTTEATKRALQAPESQDKPAIVAPGDEEFNAAGWTAIRDAS